MSLSRNVRVFIAGHRGLVGSAIVRRLREHGYGRLILKSHKEADLANAGSVRTLFEQEQPEYVFLAAAKVGGIVANNSYPWEFIYENLTIELNVINECRRTGVKRLLFLGSSCIYPRDCPQPMGEEHLLTGPLEATNRPYALAKIAGIELCWSCNREYGSRFLAAMPTNLYGLGDNYDAEGSHVIPGLLRRFHEARVRGDAHVNAWGTGSPLREFLYSEDLAEACVFLMELDEERFAALTAPERCPLINVGAGKEISIRDLTGLVAETVGYQGKIDWDSSRPDGTPRKLLDSSRITALGWQPKTSLREGLALAYADFLARQ